MKRKYRRRRKQNRKFWWISIGVIFVAAAVFSICILKKVTISDKTSLQELLAEYMHYIPERNYERMYAMINTELSGDISEEDFITRNAAIYEGIEARDMTFEILAYSKEEKTVTYRTFFDTAAGEISFENKARFWKGEEGYQLIWEDSLIFPGLSSTDKVRVSVTQAERGKILDRDGRVLAGPGTASLVGIVPGKLENREEAVEEIAQLLEITPESIDRKLNAGWVRDDYFVPVCTIPKVKEIELMGPQPDEEIIREQKRQEQLLDIAGVMISDTQVRHYPLGEAAAHLTGYVQNVTAEDLLEHAGEGYTAASVIGRSGMESLYEQELKGLNGCRIYITDVQGGEKEELARTWVRHGQDVRLTIDAELQKEIYEQFREDKSCSAAINPYTGEVLALVSTPSYNSNDFIMGFTEEEWSALSEDEYKPLFNRFRQVWCPGSTFKPVTAAVGLETGAVKPAEDYGNEGLSWQKDTSWGSYYVTTLHAYEPVILENALIYSDNIYFAKAALKIGADNMEQYLTRLGFGQEVPFEIRMQKSQYSNTDRIETQIQLADSGYGQGQILVNLLHMACIYTAFLNGGNVIRPYLRWRENTEGEFWLEGVFSPVTVQTVLEGLKKAVNDPQGTGYAAYREDVLLAGKTGTAEIKTSKEDTSGTELGWFTVFTAGEEGFPVLLVSMTEDVKDRGGSGYVVEKVSRVLETWFDRGMQK